MDLECILCVNEWGNFKNYVAFLKMTKIFIQKYLNFNVVTMVELMDPVQHETRKLDPRFSYVEFVDPIQYGKIWKHGNHMEPAIVDQVSDLW